MLILHLSDIHFRKMEVETTQDPNYFLRSELKRDIELQCNELGPPDVIIISGDIAYAGHPDEFEFATKWLKSLCDACGGSMESIFVCPGNHDVVRAKAGRNMVQHLHNAIKSQQNPTAYISSQLRDPDACRLLYESLENYNAFALQFFCDLLPPERTRATRDVVLNDGSVLRLWALNTAFVSSEHDVKGSLFVDEASFQITRENGVVNLVIAHHHLSWLNQAQDLEDHLNDVAAIQIFGHVHTNRIGQDKHYLRLTASAAHPDKTESQYEPGYNFIELNVDGNSSSRKLKLKTRVRVWQHAPSGFRDKLERGSKIWEHAIQLESWTPKLVNAIAHKPSHATLAQPSGVGSLPPEGKEMNRLRQVGLRFYQLTFSKKFEIAGRLSLLEDEDMQQPDYERFRRVFERAHQRGQLEELIAAVESAEKL